MIGPNLPPHLSANFVEGDHKDTEETPEEEEDDAYGPVLPPHLIARKAHPGIPSLESSKSQVVDDEDSDDDEIGPKPPPVSASLPKDDDDGVRDFLAREERRKALAQEREKPKPLMREEWMLRPPTSAEALQSLDTTKIKTRQFSKATGREEVKKDSTLWTETPAERQVRLAEELSGKRKRQATTGSVEDETVQKRRKTEDELRREISAFNKTARPSSLLEMHQAERQVKQSTAPEPEVIWDRERDMAIGGRLLDQTSRDKLIRDAKSLGDRFSAGNQSKYN